MTKLLFAYPNVFEINIFTVNVGVGKEAPAAVRSWFWTRAHHQLIRARRHLAVLERWVHNSGPGVLLTAPVRCADDFLCYGDVFWSSGDVLLSGGGGDDALGFLETLAHTQTACLAQYDQGYHHRAPHPGMLTFAHCTRNGSGSDGWSHTCYKYFIVHCNVHANKIIVLVRKQQFYFRHAHEN